MQIKRVRKRKARLYLTPLIDIIFLLLLFFIMTTTFENPKIVNLNIKENNTEKSLKSDDKNIIIKVNKAGIYQFQNNELNLEKLSILLKPVVKKDTEIFIINQDGAIVQDVISLIDMLNKLGNNNVNLIKS